VLPPRRHDRSVQEALRTAGQDGGVSRLPWAQPSWPDLADTAQGPLMNWGRPNRWLLICRLRVSALASAREQSVASSLKRYPDVGLSWGIDMGWRVALHRHSDTDTTGSGTSWPSRFITSPVTIRYEGCGKPVGSLTVTPHHQAVHFETDHSVGMRLPRRSLAAVVRTSSSGCGCLRVITRLHS
jgi:hypothetical protein